MKLNVIQFILWVAYLIVDIVDHNLIGCILGGVGIVICIYDFILEKKVMGK